MKLFRSLWATWCSRARLKIECRYLVDVELMNGMSSRSTISLDVRLLYWEDIRAPLDISVMIRIGVHVDLGVIVAVHG